MFQDIVQCACAEGISGPGGLDGMLLKERGGLYTQILVICTASIFSEGDQDQRDTVFFF